MSIPAGQNSVFAVETASGRFVDLSAPDPTIVLGDVAHHLATITRFA